MQQEILFSIIIPTCNRPDLLRLCLNSIFSGKQTISRELFEIIVTDDGNIDVSKLISLEYPGIKWVKGPHRGPASNRNNGARVAKGKWLIFIDDDCVADLNWLDSYYNVIRQNDFSTKGYEGAIHPERSFNPQWEECPTNLTGGYFWSANVMVEKNLFFQVGGFDENYPTADLEDVDLFYSLSKHTQIRFVPEAKVIHPVRKLYFWKDILKNTKRAKIWAYHAEKHKEKLGYKNKFEIIIDLLQVYLKDFAKNLIKFRIIMALKRLYFILICIPLLILNLNKLNNQVKDVDL